MSLEDRHSDHILFRYPDWVRQPPLRALSVLPKTLTTLAFPAVLNQDYTIQATLDTAEALSISVIELWQLALGESNYGEGTTLHWTAPAAANYFIVVAAADQAEDPVGSYQLVP